MSAEGEDYGKPIGVETSGRAEAGLLIQRYLPIFEYMNANGIDYCVVGGLAVLLHAYVSEPGDRLFRATKDADLMLGEDFDNEDFFDAYLASFAGDGETRQKVLKAMVGDVDLFTELSEEQLLESCEFSAPSVDEVGIEMPSFDVARSLKGFSLADMETTVLEVFGVKITVGSLDQLLEMKRMTIDLMSVGREMSVRTQDYLDVHTLSSLIERRESGDERSPDEIGDR